MEDATSHPRLTSAEIHQALTPNSGNSPEQQAEVIKRLDTINDSLQQMNASLQQLIRLLSQWK